MLTCILPLKNSKKKKGGARPRPFFFVSSLFLLSMFCLKRVSVVWFFLYPRDEFQYPPPVAGVNPPAACERSSLSYLNLNYLNILS